MKRKESILDKLKFFHYDDQFKEMNDCLPKNLISGIDLDEDTLKIIDEHLDKELEGKEHIAKDLEEFHRDIKFSRTAKALKGLGESTEKGGTQDEEET